MGFGLPAAIGAKFGWPDKDVWLITGDGSFQMTSQELMTAAVAGRVRQGRDPEQPLPGHGAAVAGAVLESAVTRRWTWATARTS